MSTPCKPASCRLGPVALFLLAISCSATDTPVEPTPATSSALKPADASWVLRTPAGGASPLELPAWIAYPTVFPDGLKGKSNCTFGFGPNATDAIWDFHADGACWERSGP